MVGWLVQQENIGIAKQSLSEKNLYLLRAIEISHLLRVKLCVNSQTI